MKSLPLKSTVFVLGAGFTKSFSSNSPLLKWDISELISLLKKKYKSFSEVSTILDSIKFDEKKRIDVEELLSRLHSGMPYDGIYLPEGDRKVLYQDIYGYIIKTLEGIVCDPDKESVLSEFSQYVIENEVTCITFNYDTLLDEYLWKYRQVTAAPPLGKRFWVPSEGYGFFCKPYNQENIGRNYITSWLLKLHGSLNWKIKKGFQKPYPLDSLVYMNDWQSTPSLFDVDDISIHLEGAPFVIPPILDKTVLNEQPILKVIWENAFRKLADAKSVVFIGYSFPKTDIAATYLFRETLAKKDLNKICVINTKGEEVNKMASYREILPKLPDAQFNFDGGYEWVKKNCI